MRDPVLSRPLFRRAFQQGGDVQSTFPFPLRPLPSPAEAGADFQLGSYLREAIPLGIAHLAERDRREMAERRLRSEARGYGLVPPTEGRMIGIAGLPGTRPTEEAFAETPVVPVDQEMMREQMRFAAEEAERGRVPEDEATVISEQRTAAAQRSEPEQEATVLSPDQEVSTPLDPLRQAYERRAALYGEIYGDPEQRRQEAKTRILLEVAERGLALAGGRTPEGQPTTGSFVSQAAQAFAGLPRTIGAEAAAITEQDRAMRMAQLQAAEAEVDRERQLGARVDEIMLKAMLQPQAAGVPALPVMQTPEEEDPRLREWREGLDVSKAFGTGAVFGNWANTVRGVFGLRPSDDARESAIREVRTFNNRLLGDLARGIQEGGRVSNFVLELSQGLLPQPAEFTTSPFRAKAQYEAILNRLQAINAESFNEYNSPGTTDKRREELYREYVNGMAAQAELETMLTQFNSSLQGQADPQNVRRFMMESQ